MAQPFRGANRISEDAVLISAVLQSTVTSAFSEEHARQCLPGDVCMCVFNTVALALSLGPNEKTDYHKAILNNA